jgi:hypothetical protein
MDTATGSWSANSLPNNLSLDVRKIEWLSPTAAGDTVTISNADSLVLWTSTAEAAATTPGSTQVWYFQPRELLLTKRQGWRLSQISSGTLYIFFVTE